MYKYLIETENGMPIFDFQYGLMECFRYDNWANDSNDPFPIEKCDGTIRPYISPNNKDIIYIPVGSIEFVNQWLKIRGLSPIKPINLPKSIIDNGLAGRKIVIGTIEEIKNSFDPDQPIFIKSHEKVKSLVHIARVRNIPQKDGVLFASEYIPDIRSEWRFFINKNHIEDVRFYSGDYKFFPDEAVVKEIINKYDDAPPAYTVDVMVTANNKTLPIEIHNFISCGLYGCDTLRLKQMITRAYLWQETQCEEII